MNKHLKMDYTFERFESDTDIETRPMPSDYRDQSKNRRKNRYEAKMSHKRERDWE